MEHEEQSPDTNKLLNVTVRSAPVRYVGPKIKKPKYINFSKIVEDYKKEKKQ